jgi:hypothetical protein
MEARMAGDRRRQLVLRATGLAAALALALAALLVVPSLLSDDEPGSTALPEPQSSAEPQASAEPSRPRGPSQGDADARRDRIVPAVAALPLAQRMNAVDEASSDEGVWVLSRLPSTAWGDDMAVGDTTGVRGEDWVHGFEYAELLLLDPERERVLRAYPLPVVPPSALLVQPDAVYCARQGDGALPDSMLCRVDRRTFGLTVRVFPHETTPAQDPRPGWTWDEPGAGALFAEITRCGDALCVCGSDGQREIDPVTLELLP